jgi:ribosomal protein L7/L12
MDNLEIVVFAVVVAGVIYILFQLFSQKADSLTDPTPPEVDWAAVNDPEIQDFISRGQKINAIKLYRERTGAGLKEAKDAIDYAIDNPNARGTKKKQPMAGEQDAGLRDLIREGQIDEAIAVYRKFAGVDEYTAMDAVASIEQEIKQGTNKQNPTQNGRIQALLAAGNKIEAIKVYREMTGLGLKEAKDAVEAMQRQQK